ncbi:hypothetical protein F5Y15DRAFT_396613 [Xylariaceae sp. FL0016]|nr:hypothetical protein F5Y15DRAFT_396613 [Xylariaceae sp. FL0016]
MSATANGSTPVRHQASFRATQACNQCRQRKGRCDGKTPCSYCEKHAIECVYEALQRRRGPGRSKEYIRTLEARLREATLADNPPLQSLGVQSTANPLPLPIPTSQAVSLTQEKAAVADTAAHLRAGRTRSGAKLHDANEILSYGNAQQSPTEASITTASSTVKHLPPLVQPSSSTVLREDVIELLEPIFIDLNAGYPFLSWSSFSDHLSDTGLTQNPGWRALLDSMIAMGMLFKEAESDSGKGVERAWARFNSAYALLPKLMSLDPDILVVEALLAMALFARMSTDIRIAAQLLSTAVKAYQMLTLQHNASGCLNLGALNDRHRCAFWTAYILSAELSSQCGLPLTVDDEEFGIEVDRRVIRPHMAGLSPTQQIRAEVATMEAAVWKRLYSRKAFAQPDSELLAAIYELDWGLGYWPQAVQEELRPSIDQPAGKADMCMETVLLHFAYFYCVAMVHWAARRHNIGREADDGDTTSPRRNPLDGIRVKTSVGKCKKTARAALSLLRAMPQQPLVGFWRILHYPICAIIVLLIGVLEEPRASYTGSDLWTIKSFRQFIESRVHQGVLGLQRVFQACVQMEKIAQNAIDKANTMVAVNNQREDEEATSGGFDGEFNRRAQAVAESLSSCSNPMYVAINMMTNMRTRDNTAAEALSKMLGISDADQCSGPLVAECLRPSTNGFSFEALV